jgi:hypothetical protein
MIVHVVICADPNGDNVWTHGVYRDAATAKRVFQRLTDETCDTVRIQKQRVRVSRPTPITIRLEREGSCVARGTTVGRGHG